MEKQVLSDLFSKMLKDGSNVSNQVTQFSGIFWVHLDLY